jgi:hypothetical protein
VVAPKAAVLPLVKKTVCLKSHKIVEDLKWDFNVTDMMRKMQWVVVIEDKMH